MRTLCGALGGQRHWRRGSRSGHGQRSARAFTPIFVGASARRRTSSPVQRSRASTLPLREAGCTMGCNVRSRPGRHGACAVNAAVCSAQASRPLKRGRACAHAPRLLSGPMASGVRVALDDSAVCEMDRDDCLARIANEILFVSRVDADAFAHSGDTRVVHPFHVVTRGEGQVTVNK